MKTRESTTALLHLPFAKIGQLHLNPQRVVKTGSTVFGSACSKTTTNVIPHQISAATKALTQHVMCGYTVNVGLSVTDGMQTGMVSDRLSFFRRIATGIVVGSVLAATWFHLSVIAMTSDWLVSRQHGVEQRISEVLIKHASLIAFQSMFVLIIFLCIGLPVFFVARRMGMANFLTAITSGFVVGLLVSILYGGPDFGSLLGFVKMIVAFGASGVIAAYALWYAVRNKTKSTGSKSTGSGLDMMLFNKRH